MKGTSVKYKKKRLIEIDDSDIEDLKRGVMVADLFDGEIIGVVYNPKKKDDKK